MWWDMVPHMLVPNIYYNNYYLCILWLYHSSHSLWNTICYNIVPSIHNHTHCSGSLYFCHSYCSYISSHSFVPIILSSKSTVHSCSLLPYHNCSSSISVYTEGHNGRQDIHLELKLKKQNNNNNNNNNNKESLINF